MAQLFDGAGDGIFQILLRLVDVTQFHQLLQSLGLIDRIDLHSRRMPSVVPRHFFPTVDVFDAWRFDEGIQQGLAVHVAGLRQAVQR